MARRDRHGVEIDLCTSCRGVWLDRHELDAIIERAGRFLEIPNEDGEGRAGCGYRRADLTGQSHGRARDGRDDKSRHNPTKADTF